MAKPDARLYEQYRSSHFEQVHLSSRQSMEWAGRHYRRIYGPYLPAEKDAPILDLGCGQGELLLMLEQAGYSNAIGVDVSPEQAEAARGHTGCEVTGSDAASLLKDRPGAFERIFMNDVLEHLPKSETLDVLGLARRALRPGGLLLAKVPNLSNPLNLSRRYLDFTHEAGFTRESLAQVLRASGFEIVEILPEPFAPTTGLRTFARNWIARPLLSALLRGLYWTMDFHYRPDLSGNLIAVGQRGA